MQDRLGRQDRRRPDSHALQTKFLNERVAALRVQEHQKRTVRTLHLGDRLCDSRERRDPHDRDAGREPNSAGRCQADADAREGAGSDGHGDSTERME
jgi:hypothetical protein